MDMAESKGKIAERGMPIGVSAASPDRFNAWVFALFITVSSDSTVYNVHTLNFILHIDAILSITSKSVLLTLDYGMQVMSASVIAAE